MPHSQPQDQHLLGEILGPLLEDFQYWFSRSRSLLESNKVSFLSTSEQADLLARLQQAQQEVATAQLLFKATSGSVGIEPSMLVPWHKLVSECWQISMRHRSDQESSNT